MLSAYKIYIGKRRLSFVVSCYMGNDKSRSLQPVFQFLSVTVSIYNNSVAIAEYKHELDR